MGEAGRRDVLPLTLKMYPLILKIEPVLYVNSAVVAQAKALVTQIKSRKLPCRAKQCPLVPFASPWNHRRESLLGKKVPRFCIIDSQGLFLLSGPTKRDK